MRYSICRLEWLLFLFASATDDRTRGVKILMQIT